MRRAFIKTLFFVGLYIIQCYNYAQSNELNNEYEYSKIPQHLYKDYNANNVFKNNSKCCSYYIEIHTDSSFIFYSTLPNVVYFSIGTCKVTDKILTLKWDSVNTYKSVLDTTFYKKYFTTKHITPLNINNREYKIDSKFLKLIKPSKIAELFLSSDVYAKPYCINDIKGGLHTIRYKASTNQITVPTKKGKILFRADSVWGYRFFFPNAAQNGGNYNLLGRIYQKEQTILEVSNLEGIVIYRSSTGRQNFLYFSKDRDSEVYEFTKENLKKCYKDNPIFIQLIEINKNWNGSTCKGYYCTYNIISLYNESLK